MLNSVAPGDDDKGIESSGGRVMQCMANGSAGFHVKSPNNDI